MRFFHQVFTAIIIGISAATAPFALAIDGDAWIKKINGETPHDIQSFYRTQDGGMILAGSLSTATGGLAGWVIKLDKNGEVEWRRAYPGPQDNMLLSVIPTLEGGFIGVGYCEAYYVDYSGSARVFPGEWIVKLNGEGDVIWEKIYNIGELAKIEQTKDGGFICLGRYGNRVLMKLDADGTVAWRKKIEASPFDGMQCALHETSDAGFILLTNDGAVFPGNTGFQTRISKLDGQGNLLWSYSYENPYEGKTYWFSPGPFQASMTLSDLKETPDGGFIAVGNAEPGPWNTFFYGDMKSDMAVMKIDAQGKVMWCKIICRVLIPSGALFDTGVAVSVSPDNGYMVLGRSDKKCGQWVYDATARKYDYITVEDSWIWLVKLTENGRLSWARSYNDNDDERPSLLDKRSFLEESIDLMADAHGVAVLGRTNSYGDAWESLVLNLDETGQGACTSMEINTTTAMIRNLPPLVTVAPDNFLSESPAALQQGNVTATDVPLTLEDL